MTSLGIASNTTPAEDAAGAVHEQSMRAEMAKKVALGGAWSVGMAIVFGAFDLIRSDPHDAFPLLMSWGPKAVGSIIVVYVVYDLVKMALGIVVGLSKSVERLAVAQERAAAKDDRQLQEMQTLTAYTAQQGERTHDLIVGLTEAMKGMNSKLDDLKSSNRGNG